MANSNLATSFTELSLSYIVLALAAMKNYILAPILLAFQSSTLVFKKFVDFLPLTLSEVVLLQLKILLSSLIQCLELVAFFDREHTMRKRS